MPKCRPFIQVICPLYPNSIPWMVRRMDECMNWQWAEGKSSGQFHKESSKYQALKFVGNLQFINHIYQHPSCLRVQTHSFDTNINFFHRFITHDPDAWKKRWHRCMRKKINARLLKFEMFYSLIKCLNLHIRKHPALAGYPEPKALRWNL